MVAAIKAAQKSGAVDATVGAVDLLAMLMSLVTSWLAAPAALKDLGGSDPMSTRRLNQHRKALVEVVARAVTPR
jgi:hypothetical protein